MKTVLGTLFVASCAATAAPAPQAANDSEALFKKMEAALAGSKALNVEFESVSDGASAKGTFKTGEGNKFEMSVTGSAGERKYSFSMTSDGAKTNLKRSETPAPPVPLGDQPELPAPANLAANVASALARGGAWLAQEFADVEYRRTADLWFIERQEAREQQRAVKPVPAPPAREAASLYTLSSFRAGKAEGGASAVTYDLARKDEGPLVIVTMTVWIDAKGMPVKREGQFFSVRDGKPDGPALSKWTETLRFK